MLLTSYVTWTLLDTGLKSPQLDKSIVYIRDHAKDSDNAYILALAANALAAWDAKDDATHGRVLVRLLEEASTRLQKEESQSGRPSTSRPTGSRWPMLAARA